jgi:hypothetical protein
LSKSAPETLDACDDVATWKFGHASPWALRKTNGAHIVTGSCLSRLREIFQFIKRPDFDFAWPQHGLGQRFTQTGYDEAVVDRIVGQRALIKRKQTKDLLAMYHLLRRVVVDDQTVPHELGSNTNYQIHNLRTGILSHLHAVGFENLRYGLGAKLSGINDIPLRINDTPSIELDAACLWTKPIRENLVTDHHAVGKLRNDESRIGR